MPPKRKKDHNGDSPPNKKTESNDNHEDERPPIDVNWAIPKEKRKPMYKEKHATEYAQALYQRAREEINPRQTPLPDPQLRTPVYRSKNAKDMQAGNPYKPNASLLNLFNDIKKRSTQGQDGRYNPTHLERHFEDENRNVAVVLSRAEYNDIFTLNEDQRLEVTVNNVNAHIDIIRRESSDSESAQGYFIELPRGMAVTVNGTTYTNNDLPSMPFYIGPLEGYTIIELLSQPVFFFRTRDSLRYTASNRAVTREELDRRDQNGDVAVGNTTVRWRPVADLASGTGSRNEEDGEYVEEAADPGNTKDQGDAKDPPSTEGSNSTEELEEQSSDAFADEWKSIEDPCRYVQARLLSHRSGRYGELVPRVLASVNQRQSEGTGFSYQHQGRDFRPGRTLLVPLEINENHVLLAAQVQPDKQINLRVLDPMTWRTTLAIRTSIFQRAKELLSKSKWWQDVYDTPDHMNDSFPGDAEWVPAAQITTGDGSYTYTVLNAWALAMGLRPNPSFAPSLHSRESFFIQAQQIFDLALQDELTWKVLLAFFQCTGFIKSVDDREVDGVATSPDKLHQFNLRKRPFKTLIARQTAADTGAEGKKIDMELFTLGLENGKRHRQTFASDSLSKRKRKDLTPIVWEGKWNFKDTAKELRRLLRERAAPAASIPLPPNPHLDTNLVSEDFDPCLHLRTELKRLADEKKTAIGVDNGIDEAVTPTSTNLDVPGSIAAVVRAINELLSRKRGFTYLDYEGETIYFGPKKVLGQVVLVSLKRNGHYLLVASQNESKAGRRVAVARVMDSAPWTFTKDDRNEISELLSRWGPLQVESRSLEPESIVGSVLNWMPGPQQVQAEESGYFAVISAWAVLLGVPINNNFRPTGNFFHEALSLSEAVKSGHADWKLIWAFLRCAGYTRSEQLPPPGRRFRATRPINSDAHNRIMKQKKLWATEKAYHDVAYPHYPANTGIAHTETFPWDIYDGIDRATRIPEMIKSREWTGSLPNTSVTFEESNNGDTDSVQGSKNDHDGSLEDNALPEVPEDRTDIGSRTDIETSGNPKEANMLTLPDDFDPCRYFKERREALLNDPDVAAGVEKIRSSPNELERATTTFAKWLHDQEVSLAIAAVTLGITAAQDIDGGFGCLVHSSVQLCQMPDIPDINPTIRPGRPLMVPLMVPVESPNHFVLVVIQFDDDPEEEGHVPTISILDSKPHYHDRDARDDIFNTARNILLSSRWGRHPHYPSDADITQYRKEPVEANWIPVAAQPTDNECGYYTILNAWALALGLQPNVGFFPRWTEGFFQDLIDVIHIARVGQADWRLIYAFLRCKEFVDDVAVPLERRFDRTRDLPDEEALVQILTYLEHEERHGWEGRDVDVAELARVNRTQIVGGRKHCKFWPSDAWTDDVRDNYVEDLERWGELNIDQNGNQVKDLWGRKWSKNGQSFESMLKNIHGNLNNRNFDVAKDILPHYQTFLNQLHPSGLNIHLDFHPCAWIRDARHMYERILDNKPLKRSFLYGIRTKANSQQCQSWEANMAIAAVVEAIDDKQRELYKMNNPDDSRAFAGGFTIAPYAVLNDALLGVPTAGYGIASRPRRCWFIPLNVSGQLLNQVNQWRKSNNKAFAVPKKGQGHTLLVVLQQRHMQPDSDRLAVDMYFLDSSPDFLSSGYEYLASVVAKAAQQLGWAWHRNTARIHFDYKSYPVPRQPKGGFQCGYYTFINAWILAMGLTPDPKRVYTYDTHEEAWELARAAMAGLLDWKALIAWFFCRRLTVEREYKKVPANRRFESTVPQVPETLGSQEAVGDGELQQHAQQRYDADDGPLELRSIAEAPYDLSNNVAPPPSKTTRKDDTSESLKRSHDDADLDFVHRIADTKRKSREEADDDLDFLRDSGMGCNIEMVKSAHPTPPRKRQRLGDGLSFLDTH